MAAHMIVLADPSLRYTVRSVSEIHFACCWDVNLRDTLCVLLGLQSLRYILHVAGTLTHEIHFACCWDENPRDTLCVLLGC